MKLIRTFAIMAVLGLVVSIAAGCHNYHGHHGCCAHHGHHGHHDHSGHHGVEVKESK